MAREDNQPRQSAEPHGYHPIYIDEDWLTQQDCTDEVMRFLEGIAASDRQDRSRNPRQFMTPEELKLFDKPPVRDFEYRVGVVSLEQEEEKFALVVQASRRAYSREKYGNGQDVWYGDSCPLLQQND